MSTIPSSALSVSGMNAAAKRHQASAHNVANLNTDGFQSVETVQETLPGGGVMATSQKSQTPSPVLWRGDELVVGSNTDLVRETVNQITSLGAYRANVAAFQTAGEMSDALLEIIA